MKLKSEKAGNKDSTRLENEKLKESWKSLNLVANFFITCILVLFTGALDINSCLFLFKEERVLEAICSLVIVDLQIVLLFWFRDDIHI